MTNTMETGRIQYLLKKYLSQNCNSDEKKELNLLINSLQDEDLKAEFRALWTNYSSELTLSEEDSQDILANILSEKKNLNLDQRRTNRRSVYLRTISVAASLLILVSIGIYVRKNKGLNESGAVIAKAVLVSPDKATTYTRTIVLPDGSSVVLHAGSTIDYPRTFGGKTREITLVGEAYFDVKHDSQRPFIIHTGAVKTTVLGTAFDIKAWPDHKNIIVSVTRGKVRVENDKKVLAVLTINQQINYDVQNTTAKQHKVNSDEIVSSWAKQDLDFDGATFESIAQVLSKRYGKDISIGNIQLAKTQIVSSFAGTESLENILDVLCTINSDAQFEEKNNEIIISNKN